MPLPKPMSQPNTGIPQRRRKSGLRTASDSLQQDYLARLVELGEDPTILMPEPVGPEHPALAKLRGQLTAAQGGGSLGLFARFDKGLLGALHAARHFAKQEGAPRLLDVRVDGQRRFFRTHGHVNKLVLAGVQNHDDPLCRLLAFGTVAPKHGLHLWAGSDFWSTGTACDPPQAWVEDLAQRSGVTLAPDDAGWSCPHDDRARVAHVFEGGKSLRACVPCATKEGRLWDSILARHLCGPHPARPARLAVVPAGAAATPVPDTLFEAFRTGRITLLQLVQDTQRHTGSGSKWDLAGRAFADAAALVDALGVSDDERPAALVLLALGHQGPSAAASDVLNAHRDRLALALEAIVPGEGDAFAQRLGQSDVRQAIRRTLEEQARRTAAAQRPAPAQLGELGRWIDGFARDRDVLDRRDLLQRVRKEVPGHKHPAHLCAFLEAAGFAGEGDRSFSLDQKQAGKAWAPLAAKVLAAGGDDYVPALQAYLEETGTGESAA